MERKSAFTYHVLTDLQKESQILYALQGPLLGQLAVIGSAAGKWDSRRYPTTSRNSVLTSARKSNVAPVMRNSS